MTWERGFRRLAWVVIALSVPLVAVVAYNASEHRVGFKPRLLTNDIPRIDDASERIASVKDLGVFYFPRYLSDEDVSEQLNAVDAEAAALQLPDADRRLSVEAFAKSIRAKYPGAYEDMEPTELTRRVLAKYAEYREQVNLRLFRVDSTYAKRPLWSTGVTAAFTLCLIILLQGGISVSAWILKGFSGK